MQSKQTTERRIENKENTSMQLNKVHNHSVIAEVHMQSQILNETFKGIRLNQASSSNFGISHDQYRNIEPSLINGG